MPMPTIDLLPSDATYICREDPYADYSRACALVSAAEGQRGMTAAILLRFRRPPLPGATAVERTELVLYPWQGRSRQHHPAFHVYRLTTDFTASLANWERRPAFADFPQVFCPASVCQSDDAIHCDITALAREWFCGGADQLGIALVAEPPTCLMVHSGCSTHPPYLRLRYRMGNNPRSPEERRPDGCAPEHKNHCPDRAPCGYRENIFTLHAHNETVYTPAVDIAQVRNVTFLIQNQGSSAIAAALQISPNGLDWMDDKQNITVPRDSLAAVTPYLFARYIRLGASSLSSGAGAEATVWCQAQMLSCGPLG